MKLSMLAVLLLFSTPSVFGQVQPGTPAAPRVQAPDSKPAQPPKIDPAKEADIRKLLELTGEAQQGEDTANAMLIQLKPLLVRSLPPGARTQQIADRFEQLLRERLSTAALVDLIVPVYDKYFSGADIQGLISFYETPLGHKLASTQSQVLEDVNGAAKDWAQKSTLAVLDQLAQEFPELKQTPPEEQKPPQQPR